MILLCLVGAEGKGRTHGRLTLRLLRSQHTAATADYLMVFTATIRHIISSGLRVKHARSVCTPDKRKSRTLSNFFPAARSALDATQPLSRSWRRLALRVTMIRDPECYCEIVVRRPRRRDGQP
jgi:hypothetical protein